MYSTWPAMSLIKLANVPEPDVGLESRTRIRNASEEVDGGDLELRHCVLALKQPGGHREEPLDLAVNHDRVEAFLASEVLVHNRLGNAGPGGDLLDRGAVQAALGEQAPTDIEELLAPLLAGHPPTVVRWGLMCHAPIIVG